MEPSVNYIAVLLAGIASMAVGFTWYSPLLFGKPWARLMGYTQESLKQAQQGMGALYGVSLLLALLTAYVLSYVVDLSQTFYSRPALVTGLTSASFMWLGFVMPVQLTAEIFGGRKWQLFGINTGYQLASLLAAGLIIGLMK